MTGRFFCICLLVAAGTTVPPAVCRADRAPELNGQGIEAYRNEDYDTSIEHFTDALVERPGQPELHFNRGTALSAAGELDEALSALLRAADELDDPVDEAAARYNAGNAQIINDQTGDAVDSYKEAVKLDPLSIDARKNLELTLRMLGDEEQQTEGDENQAPDQSNAPSPDQQQGSSDENDNPELQQQGGPDDTPSVSMEEAQRLLDAMRDEEQQAQEMRQQNMQEVLRQGYDW